MYILNARASSFMNVYNKHLRLKPGFSSEVTIKFTIAPSGETTDISIVSSTAEYPEFYNDIKDAIAAWRWEPMESGNTTVIAQFNFLS
jgi:TonB family protein